jgi:hypothetical protein
MLPPLGLKDLVQRATKLHPIEITLAASALLSVKGRVGGDTPLIKT